MALGAALTEQVDRTRSQQPLQPEVWQGDPPPAFGSQTTDFDPFHVKSTELGYMIRVTTHRQEVSDSE